MLVHKISPSLQYEPEKIEAPKTSASFFRIWSPENPIENTLFSRSISISNYTIFFAANLLDHSRIVTSK